LPDRAELTDFIPENADDVPISEAEMAAQASVRDRRRPPHAARVKMIQEFHQLRSDEQLRR
jgi:hypothetical protein